MKLRSLIAAIGVVVALTSPAWAVERPRPESQIDVPDGFVLQPLVETDGMMVRPRDWFFMGQTTPSGWIWTAAAEDPAKGWYETGFRIQVLTGILKGTGQNAESFAQQFLEQKRESTQVLKDCPQQENGLFAGRCLEVLEVIDEPKGRVTCHILYSVGWSNEMDMMTVSIFGTPKENWDRVRPIADAMSNVVLFGPKFFDQ